jgi:K(+)-stimulated pyrophosphate-energized sodium pump
VLIAPAIVQFSIGPDQNTAVRIIISLVAVAVIVAAIVVSKRRGTVLTDTPTEIKA